MGLMSFFLGGGADKIAGAAERGVGIFRENAEQSAVRSHDAFASTQAQFAAEFSAPERKGLFNAAVDGLNRLPRPVMALGTIGLFVYAMRDPVGFAVRMEGLKTVPDPLWWLLGAIVTFYFGAREMSYLRDGKQGVRLVEPRVVNQVVQNIRRLRELEHDDPLVAAGGDVGPDLVTGNKAIDDFNRGG